MGNALGVICAAIARVVLHLQKNPEKPVNMSVASGIEKTSPEELIRKARAELGIDTVSNFNFAVVGETGGGKSSFINGVRQIQDTHPEAAEVGDFEQTQEIKKYKHPNFKHVVLWDFPGAGTVRHPNETYFSDKKLYAFDCLLIVSRDRFRPLDFNLAKQASQYKAKFAFVRTHADVAIHNIAKRDGVSAMEASVKYRRDLEHNFREGLRQNGLPSTIPLFLISNLAFLDGDAYTIVKGGNGELDESLEHLDEDKIYDFLGDSIKNRTQK